MVVAGVGAVTVASEDALEVLSDVSRGWRGGEGGGACASVAERGLLEAEVDLARCCEGRDSTSLGLSY